MKCENNEKNISVTIGINDLVSVKITPVGKEILKHRNDAILTQMVRNGVTRDIIQGLATETLEYPKENEAGLIEIPFWLLMKIFGPHMNTDAGDPFEPMELYFFQEIAKNEETIEPEKHQEVVDE